MKATFNFSTGASSSSAAVSSATVGSTPAASSVVPQEQNRIARIKESR